MAVVTSCSDFEAQENKVCHCFHCLLQLFALKWWDWMPWSSFFECWVLSQLLHSPLSPSLRGSLVLLCFVPSVGSFLYLRLLKFLLAILIPTCDWASIAFCIMNSALILNKQGNNIEPWHTPFPISNHSIVPWLVLTVTSWPKIIS